MAVRFTGDGQQPSVTLGASLEGGFTFAGWVYIVTDRNDYSTVMCLSDGSTSEWVLLQTDASGTNLRPDVSDAANGSSTALSTGTWYFVCLTFDGNVATWYSAELADPSLTTRSSTSSSAGETGIDTLQFGESIYGTEWWNGRIEGFKLWDVVLNSSEREAERAQLDPVKTSDLVGSWRLASPSDTTDYSGNGNTLSAMTGASTESGSGVPNSVASLATEQEGYRWRDDDGSESGASWLAAQDTTIEGAVGETTRLRVLLDVDGDLASSQVTLQYKRSDEPDSEFRTVTT